MSCGDVIELSKKPRRHVGRTGPTYLEQKASQNAKVLKFLALGYLQTVCFE